MRNLLPAGPLHRKLRKATMWLAFAIAAIGGGIAVWTLFGPILLSDGGEDFTPFALYGMRRGAQLRLAAGAAALAIFVAVWLALRADDESGIAGGVKRGPVRTPGSDAGPTDQEWPANVILRRLHEYAI